MQKKRWPVAGAMAVLLAGATFAADKTEQAQAATTNTVAVKSQTLCPVMKGPVDKSQFADYDGKRIYVCCGGCIAKLNRAFHIHFNFTCRSANRVFVTIYCAATAASRADFNRGKE